MDLYFEFTAERETEGMNCTAPAVALVASPETPLASTGLEMRPASPLLPVAPSSSRVRTETRKVSSFRKGSA